MTGSLARSPAAARKGQGNPLACLVPYLYLLPHAVFFLAFIVYPILFGLYVSVHRWDPLRETQPFVGLEFYGNLFDPSRPESGQFWGAVVNTFVFVAVSTPLLVGIALGLALQLHGPILGRAFFRAVFFMPGILSVAVMATLWRWLFDNQAGLVNVVLEEVLHQRTIPFLTTDGWAWLPIVIGTVWWTVGFNMTLYLAALGGIPQPYYEAAEIDGAGSWAKFRYITLPLLTPTTLFVAVTTVLGSFQLFGQSLLITRGGPAGSTKSAIMYITERAFGTNISTTSSGLSSATAMAFVFGLVLLVFTAFQFRMMSRNLTEGRRPR